jgi:hypothetical protein
VKLGIVADVHGNDAALRAVLGDADRFGVDGLAVTHRAVPFDAGAVAADLRRRRHPNADYIGSVLTGARQM